MRKEETVYDIVQFYCVKCRTERGIVVTNTQREVKTKGPDILRAMCSRCGKKMVKFVKRQKL